MKFEDIENIILDADPGNRAESIYITQDQYDQLKKENNDHSFNCFNGPFGPVWIKIK
jgi:hypothetical protein